MREEIVERVALALCEVVAVSGSYHARKAAKAAITALLDAIETPSRGMLQAAAAEEDRCAIENYGGRPDSEDIWSAMLNQLRKEVEG